MAEPVEGGRGPWWRYVISSLPGWLIATGTALALYAWAAVPLGISSAVLAVWVASDLLLYPRRRSFYEWERAAHRMLGKPGVALTDLAPEGFARVHGEIWQVSAPGTGERIRRGDGVRVRTIEGLRLIVQADPAAVRELP